MKSGFENDRFYVEYESPGRPIGTFREELELAVKKISEQSGDKLLLSLSSGLDSQIVLHSLHSQGLPFKCAFMHMPGYNDHEYKNVKTLEKKYGFETLVVEIHPDEVKDEILSQVEKHHIMPNHFMHKKFLSLLPKDLDFLAGIEGPDIVINKQTGSRIVMEAYWNYENTRLRTLREVEREGKVLNLDRNESSEALLASILKDPIVKGYVSSLDYIANNDLVDSSGKKPSIIFNWNYYVKPIIMGRYWYKDLIYFPKSMGIETVDWIINNPLRQPYWLDVAYMEYWSFLKFLTQDKKETMRVYDTQQSSESRS
jgi:hypothetical protein